MASMDNFHLELSKLHDKELGTKLIVEGSELKSQEIYAYQWHVYIN